MAEVRAQLNSLRHSPRKARLTVNLIRGKKVEDALTTLRFLAKRSAGPVEKLLKSAVANAKERRLDSNSLTIKEIRVDGGRILRRRRPASRGHAPPIRKRTSRISLVLTTNDKRETMDKKEKTAKKGISEKEVINSSS